MMAMSDETSANGNNNTNSNNNSTSPSSSSKAWSSSTILEILVNSSILPHLLQNSSDYQLPERATNNWNTLFHGVTCPYSQSCVPWENPQRDWISFDTVFPAFISMYFVTFLEGWSNIAGWVMDARGTISLYFFCFLVLAGALFMLNLVLAILVDAFTRSLTAIQARDATLKEEQLKQKEEERLNAQKEKQQKIEEAKRLKEEQEKLLKDQQDQLQNTLPGDGKSSSEYFKVTNDGGGGGGISGIGGLDFSSHEDNNNILNDDDDATTSNATTPTRGAQNNNNNPSTTTTGAPSIAAAGRILGFVRRKTQEIRDKNNNNSAAAVTEDDKSMSSSSPAPTNPDVVKKDRRALLGGSKNNNDDANNNNKDIQEMKEIVTSSSTSVGPTSNNNTKSNTTNRTSSSAASKSKLPSSKKADPKAPPVLGFRRNVGSPRNADDDDAKSQLLLQNNGNNDSEVAIGGGDGIEDKKKLMDLFEGDDPKRASSTPYVGIVLSTTLAVSGATVNAQHLQGQGCFKILVSKAKFYGRLIRFVVRSKIVTKTWFNVTSAFLTFVNVVLLACVWQGMDETAELGLFYATSCIAAFFAVEVAVKLIALPFARFVRDVMNIVDLIVSVAAILEFTISRSTAVTALRCIRILRLLSVIDSLRDTVKILRKGLVATIPLILVLIIFLYFYAVVGMALFSGKLCMSATPNRYSEVLDMFLRVPTDLCSSSSYSPAEIIAISGSNPDSSSYYDMTTTTSSPSSSSSSTMMPGMTTTLAPSSSSSPSAFILHPVAPAFNFDNFGNSLLATFVVFIGDNWASLMTFAMERTSIFVSAWFISCFTVAGFIIVNLFVAAMIDACANHGSGGGGFGGGDDDNNNNNNNNNDNAEKKGALFGNDGGGPFHHRASMFLTSGANSPNNNKKNNKKNKKNNNKNDKNKGNNKNKRGEGGESKSSKNNNNTSGKNNGSSDDDDDDDDDDDYDDGTNGLLLRFRTITNLAASFTSRKSSNGPQDNNNNGGMKPRTSSQMSNGTTSDLGGTVALGYESSIYLGSPGSPDWKNFSALASPHRYGNENNNNTSSNNNRRTRGSSGVGGKLRRGSQHRGHNYRPVILPGENDDEFDMILDEQGAADENAFSPTGSNVPPEGTRTSSLLHRDDSNLASTLLRSNSGLSGTDSVDLAASFAALKGRRNMQLAAEDQKLASAAAKNAQQRSKMTGAQRLHRLARRAVYGEKAFSAEQREEDKFGKIMLAASRVLGVEVNELSDFDRALLLPYFEEIRSARKFEEAKHMIRRGVGYMIRHPLYRIFSVVWAIFNIANYIALAQAFRPPDHPQMIYFAYTELLNAAVVTLDIIFSIISIGVYTKHATRVTAGFFNSKINVGKTILAAFSIAAAISSFVGTTDSTNALRVFSRVLPIWLYIPQHQPTMLILISVFDALISLGNVGFISILVWITYGIMGTQLFRGTFYACSSSLNEDSWGDQTYTGDRIYSRSACLNQTYHWITYPHNFDNVWESMETLFGVATTDDWSTIAWLTVSAKSYEEAPQPGSNMVLAIYACTFIVVTALFLLNVFIAVLVNAYFETQERMERNIRHSLLLGEAGDLLDHQQRDFYDLYRRALCFVKKPPTVRYAKGTISWWIRRISRANVFQLAILILTFTNVIVQFTAYTSAPPSQETLLIVDLVFTIVLFVMIAMKIVGSGLKAVARESYWSIIEIVVVLLNFCSVIAAFVFTFNTPDGLSELELANTLDLLGFLRQSRILLLHRVMSATPGARVLVDTIVRSSQTLTSAVLLLLLFFLTYSSMGLAMFGRVAGRDIHTNFWTIPRAMYTLLAVATFDGWQDVMRTSASRSPNCDPQLGNCGIAGASQVFFMSFIVLGQYVGISLFVAILVESFSRSERQERLRVQVEDVKRFRRMWKKHCRANMIDTGDDATAASPMPITQLPLFLVELGAPLGPVSSKMVFSDPDSRQTQLPEFPELKFAWALAAEKKQQADLEKHHRQVAKMNTVNMSFQNPMDNQSINKSDTSLATNTITPSISPSKFSSSSNSSKNQALLLQSLSLPTIPQMFASIGKRFSTWKTTATGDAVAVQASDTTNHSVQPPNISLATNSSFAGGPPPNISMVGTTSANKNTPAAEKFATRSDAEKLLAKLNLPTFIDQTGRRCVAQYSLFDALIRYYYGCSLPPRTDLQLYELLLSSFGVTKQESSNQIAKPSQRISNNEPTLVVKRERGIGSMTKEHNPFKIPIPTHEQQQDGLPSDGKEQKRSRRHLLGGISSSNFLAKKDEEQNNNGKNDDKHGNDNENDDDFDMPSISQASLLQRKQSTGFVEILSGDFYGGNSRASLGGGGGRSRAASQRPEDIYSVDQISVGAMFSIVRIQAIWRGARIRNKISRLAELAAMGLPPDEDDEDNNNNDQGGKKKKKRKNSSDDDDEDNEDDDVPLDATLSQAAKTLRANPETDLFSIVTPEAAKENNSSSQKDPNSLQNSLNQRTPPRFVTNNNNNKNNDEDGGEAAGGPQNNNNNNNARSRATSGAANNNNPNENDDPLSATSSGGTTGGGIRTLMAVSKLAGIIEKNRQRAGRTEIRSGKESMLCGEAKVSIGGAKTAMKAANKFAAALAMKKKRNSSLVPPSAVAANLAHSDDDENEKKNDNNNKPSAVPLKGFLGLSPQNKEKEVNDFFGETYEVEGDSSSSDDDSKHDQNNNALASYMQDLVSSSPTKKNNNKESSSSRHTTNFSASATKPGIDFVDL